MIFGKTLIMKKCILLLTALISVSFYGQASKEITMNDGSTFLVGTIEESDLNTGDYHDWFSNSFKTYDVNKVVVDNIKKKLNAHKLLLFMGTWCGDSRREVPRIMKVLHEAKFPMDNLKIVAVDRRKEFYKKSPGGEEWGLDIRRVPTLILLKNGREQNRIVETPIESWEKDLATILNGQPYTPNYSMRSK